MATRAGTRQARQVLDRRLVALKPVEKYAPPRSGWIRAVRDALGMTAADLAARMGISGAAIRSYEDKEMSGGIRLSSLQRAADAMDCTLVYAFIPRSSLEQIVQRQAQTVLDQQMKRVRQTMALEAQEIDAPPSTSESELQAIIDSGRLWSRLDAKK
ncbi:MAG: mobile mystery protein A [Coriobacteriia bacterium]|nr:mobile mystery protein A [Coriobacteriia bacterium]